MLGYTKWGYWSLIITKVVSSLDLCYAVLSYFLQCYQYRYRYQSIQLHQNVLDASH